ncbi:hypothetical protein GCM10012290_04340 [Halolactibacillus alkaliphilus]|uniref:Uncharacterized protein n=1 Tax=Halolactibacillus alkaliphilus TaxID=442899 RepID=A0A511WZA0_9BACI|nr:hypothetical protein [Halolactibacillus alkaliphilus]GEN55932.1 hypothetical protein HAL01_03960 [Halolactibacillus alkaliphilus]GGN65543.1 hypothetical protein GCM10012290_04340 [Halolactibacillus alkaliphilus]SFO65749.1 hypothetical protein SAMN05720591_10321 [Halolactibacillus alkaliphilus]
MGKWGLFSLSIGCLMIIFAADQKAGTYDILSLITAGFFIILSIILIRKEKRQKISKN